MRKFFASLLEVFEVAVIAVAAVFLIRTFLMQPFLVSGASMVPTFADGDYLLIDQLTYRFRPPARGEVVVFRSPSDPSTFFIKRLVGLPGERVAIGDGGVVVFGESSPQGEELREDYLSRSAVTRGDAEFDLDGDEYLLLGDNRSYSFDSRSWGPLKRENIVGIVRLRLWPIDDIRVFAAPTY